MNMIQLIREALGFEVEEEFRVQDEAGISSLYKYRFTDEEMQMCLPDGRWEKAITILGMLVTGERDVVRLPWRPKEQEIYYFVSLYDGSIYKTAYRQGNSQDCMRFNSGNCYRTLEEADKHAHEWMRKLYGEDWRELLK